MQPQKNTYTHVIDVSRQGDRNDAIPAQLTLVCKHEKPQQACAIFHEAVDEWLQTTGAGKAAWKESHEDFNYGDLLDHQESASLGVLLDRAGFVSATVKRLDVGVDVGEHYDSRFDGDGTRTL